MHCLINKRHSNDACNFFQQNQHFKKTGLQTGDAGATIDQSQKGTPKMKTYRVSEAEYYNLHDLRNLFENDHDKAIKEYGEETVKEVNYLAKKANDVGAYVTPAILNKIRHYKDLMLDIRFALYKARYAQKS